MRILIFHGYLLRGTGSNIYTANLARSLARLGHEVHLASQDRDPAGLDWVDAAGEWDGGGLRVEPVRETGSPGSVTVYRPDIGGLLPVYVEDRYVGIEARAFPRLSDEEVDRYLEANVSAVGDIAEAAGGFDAALANHLIMGPLILARAGVRPFAVKNHGSDLEYTIKPHPRFLPYAREGVGAAASVLVGSRHTAESLWQTLPELDLEPRTGLGPPGVDVEAFRPVGADDAAGALEALAKRIRVRPGDDGFGRDRERAAGAISGLAAARGPRVVFVGKLIVSKGVDLLAAAWPLVHAANPGARLLVAGFGGYESALLELVEALGDGDLAAAGAIAAAGRLPEGGPAGGLRFLESFLGEAGPGYARLARRAAGSISFSGRLEHDEVAELLGGCDAMVVPSTFPEAFGMVAAEAAAAGALPVCARHSGLAEVVAELGEQVPEAAGMLRFELGPAAVPGIGESLNRWLALPGPERARIGARLSDAVRSRWSWERVADGVISASAGRVRRLPPA